MTTYDVFLSHATDDKPAVEELARRLRRDGFEPFLDKWHLVPGEPWQEALEDALAASRTCAGFVGRELGPWQDEEMRTARRARPLQAAGARLLRPSPRARRSPRPARLERRLHRRHQLLGRSGKLGEEGRRLVQGASARTLRPRRVRMDRAGGPLVRTLEGHTSRINAVARLDAQRVVSASWDNILFRARKDRRKEQAWVACSASFRCAPGSVTSIHQVARAFSSLSDKYPSGG